MRVMFLSLWVALASCGSVSEPAPAGDAPPDMGADAPPAPLPSPGRELAPAAGRLVGGQWTIDVQLGSVTSQSSARSGAWTMHGGAPLNL
jgi:hypothetical protein